MRSCTLTRAYSRKRSGPRSWLRRDSEMKYRHLLFSNLSRKKIRTTLTIGSFAVALFLFGLLAVVRGAFNQGLEAAGANRLVVVNKVSIIQPLPISYKDRLLR